MKPLPPPLLLHSETVTYDSDDRDHWDRFEIYQHFRRDGQEIHLNVNAYSESIWALTGRVLEDVVKWVNKNYGIELQGVPNRQEIFRQ